MAMGRSHPLPFEGVCGFRLVSDPCRGDETRSIPELNGGKLLNFIFLNLPEPGYPLFSNALSISHKMEMCAKVRRCESPFNPVFLTKADQRRRTGRTRPCLRIFKSYFWKFRLHNTHKLYCNQHAMFTLISHYKSIEYVWSSKIIPRRDRRPPPPPPYILSPPPPSFYTGFLLNIMI